MSAPRSQFLLGVIGFAIVMATILGGILLAGVLHGFLTPDYQIFYGVWLWICLIPFAWLCGTTLDVEHIRHPIAGYVGLLPWLLILGVLQEQFDPGNNWWLILFYGAMIAYPWMVAKVSVFLYRRLRLPDTGD